MPNGFSINISDFDGIYRAMAQKANLNNDNILDHNEISLFNKIRKTYNPNTKTFIFEGKIYEENGQEGFPIKPEEAVSTRVENIYKNIDDAIAREKNMKALEKADNAEQEVKQYICQLINQEIKQKITIEQGVKNFSVDLKYWSEKIYNIATENNFPIEVIVAIISTETRGRFDKNLDGANGRGPMQITTSAIRAFHPNAKGNWNDIFKKMDEKLLNDTLHTRNQTPEEIRNNCAKDDEFGIKVGVLTYEIKYVQAVAEFKFDSLSYQNVKKAVKGLKDGSINLTQAENEHCIKRAFYLYNGNPKTQNKYSETAMKALKRTKFNFNNQIVSDKK